MTQAERRAETRKQIGEWAIALTPGQATALIMELTEYAIESEAVRFGDLAPYWDGSGEPLVPGQATHADEEG